MIKTINSFLKKSMKPQTEVRFDAAALRRFRDGKVKGMRFVSCKGFCREIEFYISCHEAAGIHLDTECGTIIYDDRIVLTVRKEFGVWSIIDVTIRDSATAFRPVFCWKLIKRGMCIFPAKVLASWCLERGDLIAPVCAL